MTSAPEAKRRLLALLQASSALSGVTVRYGRPTRQDEVPASQEMISLAGVADGDAEWGSLGRQRQRETYTIGLSVWVFQAGDAEATLEQRAATLLAAVSAAVRSNPRLADSGGVPFLDEGMTLTAGSFDTQPVGEPGGWQTVATWRVSCVASVIS